MTPPPLPTSPRSDTGDLCRAPASSPLLRILDRRGLRGMALAAVAALLAPFPAPAQEGYEAFSAIHARNIGPAGMSGRVASVAVGGGDPRTIFVGSATGGVWRSRSGGLTWEPVFDDERVLGVGAVAVSPANPDLIWVGTGEGNPRNSAGVGRGLYRSRDEGDTWELVGLEESERIHRVVPHPTDPDVAYAGAMGPAWSDGEQRGVYRTSDGGESWERVLWVDERSGVADLVMDPENPDKLFAAMWEFRRWPWFFESGGPGSGLYVTTDGGESWERLGPEHGLPEGPLGRIGLAVAPSDPDIVYALVEADPSELLRSDDGGRSWQVIDRGPRVAPRPFYYADIRVDPRNPNRIYNLHGRIQVSEDRGATFRTVVASAIIHGDVHELWIDPDDPDHLIMGNDGGIGISRDRGRTWRFVENLPLAQFYHVSVDMDVPFNVYGGMQDNGSWYGPSDVWENRGIMNAHWRRVGGGDGFHVADDPTDPRYGYSMSQRGNLMRFDRITGARRRIRPTAPHHGATRRGADAATRRGAPVELRFNWNAGFAVDPHDSATIYLGSQFVHRSRDQGRSWEIISPDLTTDDPAKQRQDESGGITVDATGAENHTTIVTIAPSPREPGVIWVGTDDGNVQLTRDGGESWSNVVENIPGHGASGPGGLSEATWVAHVEASKHDPATAYVVFDDHRRGNWTPYVYRTTDYGRSWTSLAGPDLSGFYHALEEDPVDPDLLFLGGEFGLWVSRDGGASWFHWDGVPAAPVRDLVVHPRDHDLVLGTHGRGAWVVDDIRPLRAGDRPATGAWEGEDGRAADGSVVLHPPPPAIQHERAEAIGYRSVGHAMFFGEMRPYGALLSYTVAPGAAEGGERAGIRILDTAGETVRRLDGPADAGLNRVVWNLRPDDGPEVLPGRYGVEVTVAGRAARGAVHVRPDPRVPAHPDARARKVAALEALDAWLETASRAERRVRDALEGTESVLRSLPPAEERGGLRQVGEALRDSLVAVHERLFRGGESAARAIRSPYFTLASSWEAPSPNERRAMEEAWEAVREVVEDVNRVMAEEVEPYRDALREAGYTPFRSETPLRLPPRSGT